MSSLPYIFRGRAKETKLSGTELLTLFKKYESIDTTLKGICKEFAISPAVLLSLCTQYPELSTAIEQAEQLRAREYESMAVDAYNMPIADSIELLIDAEGKYSSAVATHLKNRSAALLRVAQINDKKRYSDGNNGGVSIAINTQNNVGSQQFPETLQEVRAMPLHEMLDIVKPSEL